MATNEEKALYEFMLDLSVGLAAAAANAELSLPSGTDKEMKLLSESIQQIAPLVQDSNEGKSSERAWRDELEDIVYEINSTLQLFCPKGNLDKVFSQSYPYS